MKVFLLLLAGVAIASAGNAIAWPGAIPVSRILHKATLSPEAKTFSFPLSQYINALPVPYQFQTPQYAYQYPQLNPISPVHPAFGLHAQGPPYYTSGVIYYPPVAPVSPIATYPTIIPAVPSPAQPPLQSQQPGLSPAGQPAGDSDTAVVDSAEFPQQDQQQSPPASTPPASQFPPASNFPLFPPQGQNPQSPPQNVQDVESSHESSTPSTPQTPESPGSPSFPQFPQAPQFPQTPQFPQFPQFPQGSGTPSFPQLPQFPSIPGFPQFPQFPSNPSSPQQPSPSPPSNFPSAINDDKGLNDEDTISVESV